MSPMMKSANTIDEYIAMYPEHVQSLLQEMRQRIKKIVPEAKEAIKYGLPTFILNGNLVHFGAYEHHIGFYPAPSGIEEFKKELAMYQTGKGTLQFPIDQPIPYDLVTRVVQFRVEENLKKKK